MFEHTHLSSHIAKRWSRFVSALTVPVLALAIALTMSGCLTDTITGPQVVSRLVYPPPSATFQATNFRAPLTGDMVVRWHRSPADTQLNFKGYFVKLWTATIAYDSDLQMQVGTLIKPIDSLHIYRVSGKLDTTCTFKNLSLGQYSIVIWGEKATDTLGYSKDSLIYSGVFDPRPVLNPTGLMASSYDTRSVRLAWTLPPQDTNAGLAGYAIYYVDTNVMGSTKTDSAHLAAFVPRGTRSAIVGGLPASSTLFGSIALPEHSVRLWIKAVRQDSVIFYTDSNAITWAGAVRLPRLAIQDSGGYTGYHNSLYLGPYNSQLDMVDDSDRADAQVVIQKSGNVVTLVGKNGTLFLTRNGAPALDTAASLDSQAFAGPVTDPSLFTTTSITLPATPSSTGVVVYALLKDDTFLKGSNEWVRFFIKAQANGTFLNTSGGVHIEARFQAGLDKAGDAHLPYY